MSGRGKKKVVVSSQSVRVRGRRKPRNQNGTNWSSTSRSRNPLNPLPPANDRPRRGLGYAPIDERPRCGKAGAMLVEVATNPFRNGYSMKDMCPKIPDGAMNTIGLVLTFQATHVGSSAQSGFIEFSSGSTSHPPYLMISAGNNAEVAANSPVATTLITCKEETMVAGLFNQYQKYRVVAGALKVNYAGSFGHGAGLCRAGHISPMYGLPTGAASWGTYASHINVLNLETYQLRDGLTVNNLINPQNLIFNLPSTNYYSNNIDYGSSPTIQFSGVENDAGAVLEIRGVLYIEMTVTPISVPYAIPTPVGEQDLQSIISYINATDHIVSGHSFQSVFSKAANAVGSGIRRVFRFVRDNAPLADLALAMSGYAPVVSETVGAIDAVSNAIKW